MSEAKLVSIIMPAYNSERYVAESIDSVLAQTYTNWELIIIDDGSIDNTRRIVSQYTEKDARIKYIYQTNQKQGKARNTGISNSKGDLIAFLDSDDLWVPKKLETQLAYLKKSKTDLIFSDGYIFTNNLNNIKGSFQTLNGVFQGDKGLELFLAQNRIPILSVLTYKLIINTVGGFEENQQIQNVEDYHLWLKLLIGGFSFYGLPDKLVYYRQHDSQSTTEDPWASEKVLYMLSLYIKISEQFSFMITKAKLTWGRNWYLRNAKNKKSAIRILYKLFSTSHLRAISVLTSFSLFFFGLTFSKRVIKKLVNMAIKQYK